MAYTVVASQICKSFGQHVVLDHVDLAVETGTVLALLGPNGAGKTTMVRILATLVQPDSGTATIAGHDLGTDVIGVRGSISLTGQYVAVDDVLTGRENMQLMAQLLHVPRREARGRTEELLTQFDLSAAGDRRAGTYSGGMRRRLDLAISMIRRPELLFLDEPTNGLDPRSREQLWGTVRALVEQGVTVLLTTQYLEEADQLADTIAVLDQGRVVARGTAEELKASLRGEVLRLRFADATGYRRALDSLPASSNDDLTRSVEVPTDATGAHLLALLRTLEGVQASAQQVSLRSPSLDDVFKSLTGADGPRTSPQESDDVGPVRSGSKEQVQ